MTRPTLEQAREAIRNQMGRTGWTDRALLTDQALIALRADGFDPRASRQAVDRAWDMFFEVWEAN